MRTTMLLSVLMVTAYYAAAQQYAGYSVPGALESTLSLNPLPVVRHELGSLTPPGTFTLSAVIAVERSSKRRVKGLEAQVEGNDIWNDGRHCKETRYIDEEALRDFGGRLTGLVRLEKQQSHDEVPSVVFAGNKSGRDPQEGVLYVPIEIGSYWTGDRYGVYVDAPVSRLGAQWSGGCQFNMPSADVSELLLLVHKGEQWLQENPPKPEPPEAAVDNQ